MNHRTQNASRFFPWYVFLPFIVFVLHSLLFRSWLSDDAGISFAYARNFIHGHGFVAQYGVEPVEGFSNPLWTLLIAPVFIYDPVDPTLYLKLISYAVILATFALVAKISQSLFRHTWWARSTTASVLVFMSVNTSFVVWTTSGLENPLYAFLCALYCVQLVMYATDPDRRSVAVAGYAGLSVAGLALTRPDGIVFLAAFPGVLAILLLNDISLWKAEGRRLVAFLAASLLPVFAYTLFRVAYFGDFFPNTYHVKGGPSLRDMVRLVFLTSEYLQTTYDLFYGIFSWLAGPLMILLLLGVFYLLFARRKTSTVVFLLPIVVCTWAIYCLLPPDWMGEYRFATPFLLALPLMLMSLLTDILANVPLPSRILKGVFLGCVALLVANSAAVCLPRSLRFAEDPTVPFNEIATEFGIRFNYYADELGISGASFLLPDLGGTLYFSRHRVYDLAGLCDRRIAPLTALEDGSKLRDHVFDLRPTFIHIHDYWSIRTGLYSDDRFRQLYVAIIETPSEQAKKIGMNDVYSGDYVLKDAIHSQETLERLRQKLRDNTQQEHPPDGKKARPFPRG
ncbi:MAG: hypothetical protein ABIB41_00025 [Nitrospirota bacterium]